MKLSIVIPVYNEEMTIRELIDRVVRVELGNIEREILVANDGSTDASALIIEEQRQAYPRLIRFFSMPINLGKGAAVRLGLHHATGDVILIQDADLELSFLDVLFIGVTGDAEHIIVISFLHPD